MPLAHGKTEGGQMLPVKVSETGAVVFGSSAGAVDHRMARFNAAADMPADITSSANVTADLVTLNTFSSTARRIQFLWHGPAQSGIDTTGALAYGAVAMGARVTVNAPDSVTAATRLTYTALTGGGTSTGGTADCFMLSAAAPFLELTVDEAITRIDAIGIPNTVGDAYFDVIQPCFLEVRVIG